VAHDGAVDLSTVRRREEMAVKKIIVVAAVSLGVLAVFRRPGPALGRMAMRKCHEMFERMPEDSPPKRMMRALDEIREQDPSTSGDAEIRTREGAQHPLTA
jgi:hypothetical protein